MVGSPSIPPSLIPVFLIIVSGFRFTKTGFAGDGRLLSSSIVVYTCLSIFGLAIIIVLVN